ncbi:MAG TPA: LysR family transcriptional regulator [Verrucomicrobiae bacterium]|jgi:DNA-binding transcriptional LysR family regulator|nr:LysR family transcriptional regulator [Verrucomicrobiae bacterium]
MRLANLHQLEIFLQVVKERSFSSAADILQMSQPSVSIQIRRLESALGIRLFERLGRTIHLTAEGELVAEYAHRISDLLIELGTEVEKFQGARGGRLVVGGNTAPGVKILPSAIAEFKKLYPEAEILLRVSGREQVERWLVENDIDVAVILGHPKAQQLRKERLCDEPRVLVLPTKHPLTKKARVSVKDIAGQRMLLPDSGDLKFIIDKIFSEKGISLQQTTFGNHEAIITAVSCGLGMSILSQATVEKHAKNKIVAIRTIERINLKSPVHIVLHKNKHLSKLGQAFLTHLRESAD